MTYLSTNFNKDSIVLFLISISKLLTMLIGMVNLFLLQYYFGIDSLGKYVSVTSLVIGVSFPIALSLNSHFQRVSAHNSSTIINEYISSSFILGIIFGAISYFLLKFFYSYDELDQRFWFCLLVIIFSCLFMVKHSLMGLLKANGKMRLLSIIEIIVPFLFFLIILLAILFFTFSASFLFFVTSYFLVEIFIIFLLISIVLKKSIFLVPKINKAFELLNYIKKRIISNISQSFNIYGLIVLISYAYGPSVAGFIKILERITFLVQLPSIASNQMLVRDINTALVEKSQKKYSKIFSDKSKNIFIYQFMLLIIIIPAMHFLDNLNYLKNTTSYDSYKFIFIIASSYLIVTLLKWPFLRSSLVGNIGNLMSASLYAIFAQILFALWALYMDVTLIVLLLIYPLGIILGNVILAVYTKQAEYYLWQ